MTMTSNHPRLLLNTIDSIINPHSSVLCDVSAATCEQLTTFFHNKVSSVRHNTCNVVMPLACCLWSIWFYSTGMKLTNCPLDVMPARLLKELFSSLGSSLLALINACLNSGSVPAAFKQVKLGPLKKKRLLDPTVLSIFRPIYHFAFPFQSFFKKSCFHSATNELRDQLHLWLGFQSGFRSRYSTESALSHNDIALSVDSRNPAMLVLLDLTEAFDTVDHVVLVSLLEHYVGNCGTTLQ